MGTYDMASAILMKKGLETGMTAHGHHDFMLSDDVIHKVHIGHYTFYHKSIIKQPKNITIAEDIFARNYVSGEGTSIYDGPRDFAEDSHNDYFKKDMLAMIIPAEDRIQVSDEETFAAETGSRRGRLGKVTNPMIYQVYTKVLFWMKSQLTYKIAQKDCIHFHGHTTMHSVSVTLKRSVKTNRNS